MTKNAENLDQILNIENSSINFVNSNANVLISKEERPVQKNQQCQKQHVLSKDELHNDELSLENKNVSDKCYQQYSISNSTYNVQNSHMEQNNSSTNLEDEPLDCTADVTHMESTKHEPLDYTLDIDTETGYKTCLPNESLYKSDENFETKGNYLYNILLV